VAASIAAMRSLLLLLLVMATMPALEELDKEVARHQVETAKLDQDHQQAVAKARQKSVATLERLAAKQTRAGDLAGATLVWKEVLRLDQDHAEARRFFSALGTLDSMLAEVATTTDVLGNPSGGAVPRAGRRCLLLLDGATLTPGGAAINAGFAACTVELLVGKVQGDGTLYSEGGSSNGQVISVAGPRLSFLARNSGVVADINAPFDRSLPWTHIAATFDNGKLTLWLNGKAAASGPAPFPAVAQHGTASYLGGLGKGGGMALAGFRLTRAVRYQAPFAPPADLAADPETVLGISAASLAPLVAQATVVTPGGQPPLIATVPNVPDGSLSWTASGVIGLQ
jgi:hypothetical protein